MSVFISIYLVDSMSFPLFPLLILQMPEAVLGIMPMRDIKVVIQVSRQTGLARALGPEDGDEEELLRTRLHGRASEDAPCPHQLETLDLHGFWCKV
jgi:hypothetical protein